MEEFFSNLKKSIIQCIREIDKTTDIYFEEIKGTDKEAGTTVPKSYYYVDFISKINTVDKVMSDVSILVDIASHEEKERNEGYLKQIGRLDSVLRPALLIGDRTATINNIDYKIVDNVLHAVFFLNLRIARAVEEEGEPVEEVVFSVKGE